MGFKPVLSHEVPVISEQVGKVGPAHGAHVQRVTFRCGHLKMYNVLEYSIHVQRVTLRCGHLKMYNVLEYSIHVQTAEGYA